MFSWILDHNTRFWLLAGLTGFVYLMILSLVFGLLLFVRQKIAGETGNDGRTRVARGSGPP